MARQEGWNSNVADVSARMLRAVDAGLIAAAIVYGSEVVRRMKPGFTSGAYVSGTLANSVTIGRPEWRGDKRWISVGTNYDYALYWELGHLNLWSANYEHVPIWVPTLTELAPQMRDAFVQAYNWSMKGVGGSGGGAVQSSALPKAVVDIVGGRVGNAGGGR